MLFRSRNAKNRPEKYGEIYGDNLNSVAEVAHSVGMTKISMDGAAVAVDRKRYKLMASMESTDDTAMMGIEEDGVVMDVDVIRKLKLGNDEKFKVSVDEKTYDYVLDGGKIRYYIPMETDYDGRTFPDVSKLESNETGRTLDTSVIEKLYKDALAIHRRYGDTIPMDSIGVFIISDANGMTAQLVEGTNDLIGKPYILSREGTEKEYSARYTLNDLRALAKANPTGKVNFDTDDVLLFSWGDPAYNGRMMVAPDLDDRNYASFYKMRREGALDHHRKAFASPGAVSSGNRKKRFKQFNGRRNKR